MQSIRLPAVKWVASGIYERTGVLRALPDHFLRHRRSDTSGIEEEHIFPIEIEHAVLLEFITAANEWRDPRAVWIKIGVLDSRLISKSAGCGIADRCCLDKYLFQASVGCKGFAFFNSDGGERAQRVRVQRIAWFVLNGAIEVLERGIITRPDGVEGLAGNIDELHLWRVGGL